MLYKYFSVFVLLSLPVGVCTSKDDDAARRGSIWSNSRSDGHRVALLHSQDRRRTPCCVLQVSEHCPGLYLNLSHILRM